MRPDPPGTPRGVSIFAAASRSPGPAAGGAGAESSSSETTASTYSTSPLPVFHTVIPAQFPQVLLTSLATDPAVQNNLAIVFGKATLSYKELNEQVDRLAAYLQSKSNGVKEGDRVGVFLSRGMGPVITMFALWKLGASYFPLDPAVTGLHANMLQQAILDGKLKACITYPDGETDKKYETLLRALVAGLELPEGIEAPRVVSFPAELEAVSDSLTECEAKLDREAFVVFSSGSTGVPKGMGPKFKGLLYWHKRLQELVLGKEVGGVLAFASIGFDPSIWEVEMALTLGVPLYVADEDTRTDPYKLAAFIKEHHISDVTLVPSVVNVLITQLAELKAAGLRRIYITGEACSPEIAARCAAAGVELINCYGPSELTFGSVAQEITMADFDGDFPWIPDPKLPLKHIVVVKEDDRSYRMANADEEGELWIIGDGNLIEGYLGVVSEKTRASIVPELSVRDGARVEVYDNAFKTGDKVIRKIVKTAKGDENRNYYRGRGDTAVKVNGVFISLEGIESRLRNCFKASDGYSVAVAYHPAKGLTAFIQMREDLPPLPEVAVKEMLISNGCPNDELPHRIVFASIPRLPLSSKVDRATLQRQLTDLADRSNHAPRTQLEKRLLRLWEWIFQVESQCRRKLSGLGKSEIDRRLRDSRSKWVNGIEEDEESAEEEERSSDIGIRQSFAELGGDSLRFTAFRQLLEESLGVRVTAAELGPLAMLTVEKLAAVVYPKCAEKMYFSGSPSHAKALPEGVELLAGDEKDSSMPVFIFPDVTATSSWSAGLITSLVKAGDSNRRFYGINLGDGFLIKSEDELLACVSIQALAQECAARIRRIQPEGPYCLAGYSFGAALVAEIAYVLEQQHQTVTPFLIDGINPEMVNKDQRYFAKELSRLIQRSVASLGWEWSIRDFRSEGAAAAGAGVDMDFTREECRERLCKYLEKFSPEEQVNQLSLNISSGSNAEMVKVLLYCMATARVDPLRKTSATVYLTQGTLNNVREYSRDYAYSLGWGGGDTPTVGVRHLVGDRFEHLSVVNLPLCFQQIAAAMKADLLSIEMSCKSVGVTADEASYARLEEAMFRRQREYAEEMNGNMKEFMARMMAVVVDLLRNQKTSDGSSATKGGDDITTITTAAVAAVAEQIYRDASDRALRAGLAATPPRNVSRGAKPSPTPAPTVSSTLRLLAAGVVPSGGGAALDGAGALNMGHRLGGGAAAAAAAAPAPALAKLPLLSSVLPPERASRLSTAGSTAATPAAAASSRASTGSPLLNGMAVAGTAIVGMPLRPPTARRVPVRTPSGDGSSPPTLHFMMK